MTNESRRFSPVRLGTAGRHGVTWTADYQCMLIGSYGDQYSAVVKERVVPKESPSGETKPSGKFLGGVSDDLEIVQDMIVKDPRKRLAYVLPDVPGAQRSYTHYLNKIETFLQQAFQGSDATGGTCCSVSTIPNYCIINTSKNVHACICPCLEGTPSILHAYSRLEFQHFLS